MKKLEVRRIAYCWWCLTCGKAVEEVSRLDLNDVEEQLVVMLLAVVEALPGHCFEG